jgi:excisionase family DNA binding protein
MASMAEKQPHSPRRNIEPEWGPIPDVQQITGLGRTTIYKLIGDGTLESITVGKRRLVRLSSARSLGAA